ARARLGTGLLARPGPRAQLPGAVVMATGAREGRASAAFAKAAFGGYALLGRLAAPLVHGYLRRRLARGREEAGRLGERLGQAGVPRPDGPLIWIHGASVGEAQSALPLIERLRTDWPDFAILVT